MYQFHEPTAAIFDMDGTLVDTDDLHVRAEHYAFRQFGIPVKDSDWDGQKGTISEIFMVETARKYGRNDIYGPEILTEKIVYLKKHADEIKLFPFAEELLSHCAIHFTFTALCTSSGKLEQQVIFDALNLNGYFDVVINADHPLITEGKPSPIPYKVTLSELLTKAELDKVKEYDVPVEILAEIPYVSHQTLTQKLRDANLKLPKGKTPEELAFIFKRYHQDPIPIKAIAVEDSVNGILSAKRAGLRTIAVTQTTPREFLRPHSKIVVDDLGDVLRLLRMPRFF